MKALLTAALLAFASPAQPPRDNEALPPVLILSVPGEPGFEPGTTAEVGDLFVDRDGFVQMVFVSAPHVGIELGCWYSEHDWFGYGTGGDWGPYAVDYVLYSPLLRSWIRQVLAGAGQSTTPDCR
jgi:hypothetical protein